MHAHVRMSKKIKFVRKCCGWRTSNKKVGTSHVRHVAHVLFGQGKGHKHRSHIWIKKQYLILISWGHIFCIKGMNLSNIGDGCVFKNGLTLTSVINIPWNLKFWRFTFWKKINQIIPFFVSVSYINWTSIILSWGRWESGPIIISAPLIFKKVNI